MPCSQDPRFTGLALAVWLPRATRLRRKTTPAWPSPKRTLSDPSRGAWQQLEEPERERERGRCRSRLRHRLLPRRLMVDNLLRRAAIARPLQRQPSPSQRASPHRRRLRTHRVARTSGTSSRGGTTTTTSTGAAPHATRRRHTITAPVAAVTSERRRCGQQTSTTSAEEPQARAATRPRPLLLRHRPEAASLPGALLPRQHPSRSQQQPSRRLRVSFRDCAEAASPRPRCCTAPHPSMVPFPGAEAQLCTA